MKKEFLTKISCFVVLLIGGSALEAKAATFIVTRTDDRAATCNSGVDCSLREAMLIADGGDVIEFASPLFDSPQTITLTSGQPLPLINTYGYNRTRIGRVTINGRGANMLIINGNNATGIISTDNALSLNLNGVTLTNGNAGSGYGGGINVGGQFSTSNLNQVVIKNCTASKGGAIYANNNGNAPLTINNSTIYNNSTSGQGSAIFYYFAGAPSITNSTISGNTSPDPQGAAIYVYSSDPNIVNSTITKNSANGGNSAGAIYNDPGNYGYINIKSSIVAENPNPGSPNISSANYLLSLSYSLTSGNPYLLPLNDYAAPGGTLHLPTHALDNCSPAINLGDPNTTQTTDERGAARVQQGRADIGAFESNLSPCPAAITVTNGNDQGSGSLRQALNDVAVDGTISFASGVSLVNVFAGTLSISRNVTVNANPATPVTLQGNSRYNLLYIYGRATANLTGLNFTGGGSGGSGGAIENYGTLNASFINVYGNQAPTGGGVANYGTINAVNSTFSGNIGGGILNNGSGILTLLSSTVSGNTGGGIFNSGTMSLLNSTVSGNQYNGKGAGIYNNSGSNILATILNSTVTDNHSVGWVGAGVWNDNSSDSFRVRNSIVGGNFSSLNRGDDFLGVFTDQGNNLIRVRNPGLAPLGNYGGATQTHALLQTSPALDAGNSCVLTANGCGDGNAALTTDQRGGSQRKIGASVDIGAFERSIAFNQSALSNGYSGTSYSQTLSVTRQSNFADFDFANRQSADSPAAPFTFSIIAGQLPPGLSLSTDGTISGTPVQTGTFTFIVKAVDNADVTASAQQFTMQVLGPTAATVSVSGRVITLQGRGLTNAVVALTDASGNMRTARTTTFGYYRFLDVEAGQTYIFSVRSKRFQFAPQVINVTEDLSELNFTGR